MLIAIYLAAIVTANLSVAYFGPAITPVNAFLLIGLDLVCRDRLHEQWQHDHLWTRMAFLLVTGSAISYALNHNAGPIALASCLAFGAAGLVDAVTYHHLRHHPWLVRSNGSNVPSAIVDSVVFPTVAFGAFLPWTVAAQVVAKIAGGIVWSYLIGTIHQEEPHYG